VSRGVPTLSGGGSSLEGAACPCAGGVFRANVRAASRTGEKGRVARPQGGPGRSGSPLYPLPKRTMKANRLYAAAVLLCVAVVAVASPVAARQTPSDAALLQALEWRPIGPANMMGRVTDVEGIPSPSKTFYVA